MSLAAATLGTIALAAAFGPEHARPSTEHPSHAFQPVVELDTDPRSEAFALSVAPRDSRLLLGTWQRQRELVLSARGLRSQQARDWAPTLLVAGLLMTERAAETSLDEKIADGVDELRRTHHTGERSWHAIGQLGDAEVAVGLLGLSWLTTLILDSPRARLTVELSAEALLDAALLTQGLKALSGRARPHLREDGSYLGGPERSWELRSSASFPSGHACAAMAVATVVAGRNSHRSWVAPLAYTLAAGVAASRVHGGSHYASDVIVGALLGHAIGRVTLARLDPQAQRQRRWDWSLQPTWGSEGSVALRFSLQRRPAPQLGDPSSATTAVSLKESR